MPRHDLKAYETLTARMPQALVDQARQYAQQHGATVADLLREGLALRLEAEGPDRDPPRLALDPAVLDVVAEALGPRILTWLDTAMRGQTPVRLHTGEGHTEVRQCTEEGQTPVRLQPSCGQTEVRPETVPIAKGQTEDRPVDSPQDPVAETVSITWQPETITAPAPPTRTYYRQPDQAPTFDPTRYFVGALCPEQHRYQGHLQSLRYLHGEHTCVTCRRERNATYNARKRARQAQRLTAPQSGSRLGIMPQHPTPPQGGR